MRSSDLNTKSAKDRKECRALNIPALANHQPDSYSKLLQEVCL